MKHYRVHLSEEHCGDVFLDAEDRDEAERKALANHGDSVDWYDEGDIRVTNVDEVDDEGNEIG